MNNTNLIIRHLCFSSPLKKSAIIKFDTGLNVIYGASDSGKSFILEAIDFMLGSSKDLRDIPERVGYDRVWLGIEDTEGNNFTLLRSADGGKFTCYLGLHFTVPEEDDGISLTPFNPGKNDTTLSFFLLEKINLANKLVRKNKDGKSQKLSFRNLCHLNLVREDNIQKESSPILTGQYLSATAELSVFKLLLTGVDDSAFSETSSKNDAVKKTAKIEVINEIILNYNEKLEGLVDKDTKQKDVSDQLSKLIKSLLKEQSSLKDTEEKYRENIKIRTDQRNKVESIKSKKNNIDNIIARFGLLNDQYSSDLRRLEGIIEAGNLISALNENDCPLCGAKPDTQHLSNDCDGNVNNVVAAALVEKDKILILKHELADTVGNLRDDASQFDIFLPKEKKKLKEVEDDIKKINPSLSSKRVSYKHLLEKKTEVEIALGVFQSISDLEKKLLEIKMIKTSSSKSKNENIGLSDSVLGKFSECFNETLKSWNFPDVDTVHFDRGKKDFVISHKLRGNRGKGLRALSHAAFTVSLLQYTQINGLPHPGFIILDTPLLAYREPEGEDDDLTGTDVMDQFYNYFSGWNHSQIIILENDTPPKNIAESSQTYFFSKNPNEGRYGFFPHE